MTVEPRPGLHVVVWHCELCGDTACEIATDTG